MRYALQSSLCTLLFFVTTPLLAEETKAPWWKFGRGEESSAAPSNITPAPTMTPAPEAITPIEEDSWFSLPKWQWPTFGGDDGTTVTDQSAATGSSTPERRRPRWRFGKPEHHSPPRNTWAQRPASTETSDGSAWENLKTSTRNAWTKTVDFVTPGDESDGTAVASRPQRPGWWQTMFGQKESSEGPQTVTEWMAQDRIDP